MAAMDYALVFYKKPLSLGWPAADPAGKDAPHPKTQGEYEGIKHLVWLGPEGSELRWKWACTPSKDDATFSGVFADWLEENMATLLHMRPLWVQLQYADIILFLRNRFRGCIGSSLAEQRSLQPGVAQ